MKTNNKKLDYLLVESNPLIQSDYDRNRYELLIKVVSEHRCTYAMIIQAYTKQVKNRILKYGFKSMEDKSDLLAWIKYKTPVLDDSYNLTTRCYWIFHGMSDFPKCKLDGCQNKIGVGENVNSAIGYNQHCCRSHSVRDKAVQEKISSTHTTRYGKRFNNRKQAAQTCKKRYGEDITNPSQIQDVKDKKAETCMKNYGVRVPAQSEVILARMRKTNNDTYGYDYAAEVPEIRQKMAETNIKNIGVDNPFKLRSTAEKGLGARRKKYGTVKGNKTRYVYLDGVVFDSSWELYVWIYCIDQGLTIKREPCRFQYFKDKTPHWYYPDFEINGNLVEVKGDNFFNKAGEPYYNNRHSWKEKYQCAIDNGVKIWRSTEIKPIIRHVRKIYGKTYVQQFRITECK